MSFLDSLSEYLQQVGQSGEAREQSSLAKEFSPAFARNALIRCLERLEAQAAPGGDSASGQSTPAKVFLAWQADDKVVVFTDQLARLLRGSIGMGASEKDMKYMLETALARQVGLDESLPSRIRTMELDRLANIAHDFAIDKSLDLMSSTDVYGYCVAIRAVRNDLGGILTSVGRVFLELKGRDAIRWLLHVESAQSFGVSDPWRISRETASRLLQQDQWQFWADDENRPDFSHNWVVLKRLESLGVVRFFDGEDPLCTGLEVLPTGRQLLSEIASSDATSMSVLAESVLSDLTISAASVVKSSSGKYTSNVESTAVAEATVRHSRLVAHEIRNMLVPVKTALGAFYREVLIAEHPGDVVARRKESIDRGIDSVFRFIGQLVELSQFAATPPEPFDMLATIRDAISVVDSESGRHIEQVLPAQLPPVSGHRARVVTAITNILRNATQVVSTESPLIRIEAGSIEGSSAVRLLIDDNGPGVPENMRRAIFDEGVSLRGGSGLGLALVREVFEKQMRGLVACETSPLGGARFVVRLPATGTERP